MGNSINERSKVQLTANHAGEYLTPRQEEERDYQRLKKRKSAMRMASWLYCRGERQIEFAYWLHLFEWSGMIESAAGEMLTVVKEFDAATTGAAWEAGKLKSWLLMRHHTPGNSTVSLLRSAG